MSASGSGRGAAVRRSHWELRALAHKYFGDPAHTYNFGPYTVMVWNRNLLPEIQGNPQ